MIRLSEFAGSATARIRSFGKHINKVLVASIAVALITFSCEEEPTSIGEGILPLTDFDSIVAVDTMSVNMFTVFSDSATSFLPSTSYLGNVLDPYFGLSSADFVTQLWLAQSWPGEGYTVDSVKLSLHITNILDEMLGVSTMNIYEIDEVLTTDSVYLVNREVPIKTMLATVEMPPVPEGSDTIIMLDMPVSFGDYILRDTSMLYLRSDSLDFRDYMYGLYFEYPQTDNYHMLELDVQGESTYIDVYYTNASGSSRSYRFLINTKCINYNRFLHDYDQADPDKKIKYINEPVKDTLAYVQPMEGVYTTLTIPGLEELRSLSSIAVNKARLHLPVYYNEIDYTEEMVPPNILVRYDSLGTKRLLTDYLVDNSGAFLDGSYSKVTNKYKLNIANFVQSYFKGDIIDPEIEIYLPELGTKNLIIKANRPTDDAVRFELVYTVLKEEE